MGNSDSKSKKKNATGKDPINISSIRNSITNLRIRPTIEKVAGNKERMLTIEVDRNRIYEEATCRFTGKIKELEKPSVVHEKPVIKFKDADELDVDGSGFRREYYSVYFQKCIGHLFEGNGRQMLPRKDATSKNMLTALGIGIVECILNWDCGFPYLHVAIYKTLMGHKREEVDKHLDIDSLPDGEIKTISKQINGAQTEEELGVAVLSHEADFINFVGWPTKQKITMANKDELLQFILRWYIIDHRQIEIDQLRRGLNFMGFLNTIKSNAAFEPLFVYSKQYSITATYMKEKLTPLIDELEDRNKGEKLCKSFAKDCIHSLDDKEARLLFAFITNLYDPPIEEEIFMVSFNRRNPERTLPESYTCLNRLVLPLGNTNSDSFKEAFIKAICENDY